MQLENKTAVITGAGSGIGEALSRRLAASGASLALLDIHADRIETLAASLREQGVTVTCHAVDVGDRDAMAQAAQQVLDAHGKVELLVNNAGVTLWGSFEENDLDNIEWLFKINFYGVVHGCKFFLPYLKQRPTAKIVNVSSMFGWVAAAGQSAYCASKYAVRGLSEALATELEDSNVSVMLVHPGGVNTNLMRDSRAASEEFHSFFADMMARSKSPEDVAALICKGIQADRFRVRTGPESYMTEWIKRLSPVHGQRWLGRYLKRTMGV